MQSLQKTAAVAARTGRKTLLRQPCRFAHDAPAHGHGSATITEGYGMSFWATIAIIPAGWALYAVSRTDGDRQPFLTRMINQYTESQERWAARNDMHVRLVEQAGEDRVLFMNTKPQEHVEMRFPEIMNNGSPYNVPAGSQVQMEKVIEKYRKMAYEDNERKLEALRNNEIKSEQPFDAKARLRKPPSSS